MDRLISKRNDFLLQSLLVLAFAIPWAKKALPSIIAITLLLALYNTIRKKSITIPSSPAAPLSLFAIFLLLILGTTYTEHPAVAWNEIGIKLSFFVFPLLAFIIPNFSPQESSKIELAFISGCFLFIVIAIWHAAYEVIQHKDFYYATYDRLSWYIHPTYAAQYQAVNLYFLGTMVINGKHLYNKAIIHYLAIALVLIFIVLLSSKASYIAVLATMLFLFVQAYSKGVPIIKSLSALVITSSLFIFTILNLPLASQRVENAINDLQIAKERSEENDNSASQATSTQMRLVTWNASLSLLMENPFGTGTGDTQQALNTIYLNRSEEFPAEKNLNAHNQYLQLGAELGWPGIISILLCLLALWIAHGGNLSTRLFVMISALNFLFESMLEAQAGIVFFSFWVLIYSKIEK
jgi:O-antigen ligase